MGKKYQERREKTITEAEETAAELARVVGLEQIFSELGNHLSQQNFQVEIKETTELIPRDNYHPLFAYFHTWIFRWREADKQTINGFLISVEKSPPFFNLRVTGGGTGETTTDFDLGLGIGNLDPERFKTAVAKAFTRPITKSI